MSSRVELEPGKTLLLDGPASAAIVSGRVSVFGAELGPRKRVVVRKGRRLPVEALEPSVLEVITGLGGAATVAEGSSIPDSWREAAHEILSIEGPVRVMILGGVDVGKTSLCTYLANEALKAGRSVGIIDADVGQSDIGPPCTIGFAKMEKPLGDLADLRAQHVFFLGDKTPSYMVDRALEGIRAMMEAATREGVDLLIVNTDGWIHGREAAEYKKAIASIVEPHLILALKRGDELDHIIGALEGWEIRELEVSPFVRERDREVRRELRALGYRRYLDGAKAISVNLDWIELEGHLPGVGLKPSRRLAALASSILGFEPLYCGERQDKAVLVVGEEDKVDPSALDALEAELGKPVKVVRKGEEEGLLVALYDKGGRFLGIGVVLCTDYRKRSVRVLTPVEEGAVAKMCVGRIKLSPDGEELGGPRA